MQMIIIIKRKQTKEKKEHVNFLCQRVVLHVTPNVFASFKEDNFGTFIDGDERFESRRFMWRCLSSILS